MESVGLERGEGGDRRKVTWRRARQEFRRRALGQVPVGPVTSKQLEGRTRDRVQIPPQAAGNPESTKIRDGGDQPLEANRLMQIGEHTRDAAGQVTEMIKRLSASPGQAIRIILIAACGATVAAPVVAAAYASWGALAPAVLNQLGAFGAGYMTNLVSDWLKRHPDADLTNEETVREALGELLLTR